jgi:hypothetical protein
MRTASPSLAYDSKRLSDAVKAGLTHELLRRLATDEGICFDASLGRGHSFAFQSQSGGLVQLAADMRFVETGKGRPRFLDSGMAMDVQSELVTVSNAGIPYFLANWLDPKIIPILVSPMMAAVIAGETMKGDWLTETAMFLTAEAVGETSAYGDYSQSGSSNVNVNFPQRQNFLFQCFLQYGQREVGRMGLAKLDWVSQQQQSNALILMKALNYMYFYGVAGLENYGLLNDPSLPPSLTPTYSWLTNSSATANTIYQDVVRLFIQLQSQSGGVVQIDSKMVLALSPTNSVALKEVTLYNTNSVQALLEQNFPNIRIETAVEYGPPYSTGGQLVQLIAEEVDGQRTLESAFSSKLMAHNMVVDTSSWRQKRSSGGFGTIIYRPMLIASMLG